MTFNPDNPREHETADDPFASASSATLRPRETYGQVDIDAWYCALVKGQGKVPYDPVTHKDMNRCTAIDLTVSPLAEMNLQFSITRSMIAESREWAGITWKSVKALGITSARELKDRWAKVVLVPTGRTYRNSAGEEKEATTLKFLALYESEDACRQAFYDETPATPDDGNLTDDEPIPGFESENEILDKDDNNGDKALETAIPFITAYAKMHGWDIEKTREACRTQPMIAKAIDVDSDEFAEIVAEAAQPI